MAESTADELALLRRTVRRFLSGKASPAGTRRDFDQGAAIDRNLWREMGSLGWLAMATDDDELGVRALGVIAEETGAVVFDQPVLAANIVSRAIARSGSPAQRDRYLAPLAAGELVATMAAGGPLSSRETVALEAARTPEGFRLCGRDLLVERGHEADVVLVAARTSNGGVERFLVPAGTRGVRVMSLHSLDLGRRYVHMSFDDVDLDAGARLDGQDDAPDGQLAIALACAESVGAAAAALEMTIGYMRTRVVFGRILGSYQVIKHRLTDMSLWLETSRAVTESAIDAVARGDSSADELASIAKAYVGEKTPLLGRDCVQLHGGIGFTWEHDIHLFLRRIEANALLLGDVDEHLLQIADLVVSAS